MTRSPLLALAVVSAILAATVGVRADYKDSFKRGVQAYRRGNWPEAFKYFMMAIEEKTADSGESVPISGFGDLARYHPHFYLGVVLSKMNDCRGALKEWERSEGDGAIAKADLISNLKSYRTDCEKRVASAKATTSASPAVTPSVATPPPVTPGAATPPPAPPAAVTPPAPTPPSPVAAPREGAGTPAAVGRSESPRVTGDTGPAATPPAVTPPAAAPLSPVVVPREGAGTPAAVGRSESPPVVGPPLDTRPTGPPANDHGDLAGTRPPRELLTAARLFFSGQYQDALGSLAPLRYAPGPAAAQASLFRAASSYALYLLGGEKDEKLLEEAVKNLRLCRQVDPQLHPDPRAFSPRFVQFFNTRYPAVSMPEKH
jgi:hypothetical protein